MSQSVPRPDSVSQCDQSPRALELTFHCSQGLRLLTSDPWNRMLSASVERAVKHYDCDLLAFVYMPDHVRLVVAPRRPDLNVSRLLYMIKRTFSHWIKGELHAVNRPLLKQLTRRERPGRYVFRFWEAGPGHIRALTSPEALADAVAALHDAPASAGLCDTPEGWKWSSWRQYHLSARPPDRDLPRFSAAPIRVSPALPSV